jgi:hypothetical protein
MNELTWSCRKSTCSRASRAWSKRLRSCGRCSAPVSALRFGCRGWAWARSAIPCCPVPPIKLAASLSRSAGRRYVDYAIRDLARQLDALGARRDEVEVKLFGGGDVLVMTANSKRPSVGTMNCEVAIKVLAEEGFAVNASSLGGTRGVNIHFNTETGEVLLQRHSSMAVLPQSVDCQTRSPRTEELTWTGQKSGKSRVHGKH